MTDLDRLRRPLICAHAAVWFGSIDVREAVVRRTDWRDEQGDIAARTVGIAIMAALAIAVGGIITTKVTNKANSIKLDAVP